MRLLRGVVRFCMEVAGNVAVHLVVSAVRARVGHAFHGGSKERADAGVRAAERQQQTAAATKQQRSGNGWFGR